MYSVSHPPTAKAHGFAGCFFSSKALVYFAPVSYLNDRYQDFFLFDVAENAIVAHPVTPKAFQVSREGFPSASRVFQSRNLMKIYKNFFCHDFFEFVELFFRLLR